MTKLFNIDNLDLTYIKWGIKARWYGLIGRLFRSKTYINRSVKFWGKRCALAMYMMHP